ncbi:MAG: hypothetical protein P8Y61_02600 [Gammaproteobacteria bacterium]|jgi:lysyl-tRNA synthetase class II
MKTNVCRGAIYAAILGVLVTGQAYAAYGYFTRDDYEDEVNRCIDLLRPALSAKDGDRVIYEIQEIELRGPWYQFEISATVVDAGGVTTVDGFRVGCKANRWVERAELAARDNGRELDTAPGLLALDR